MYSLNKPVAELRTKMRQEFERHRYVSQLPVVDMLIFQSDVEFQVRYVLATAAVRGKNGGGRRHKNREALETAKIIE